MLRPFYESYIISCLNIHNYGLNKSCLSFQVIAGANEVKGRRIEEIKKKESEKKKKKPRLIGRQSLAIRTDEE